MQISYSVDMYRQEPEIITRDYLGVSRQINQASIRQVEAHNTALVSPMFTLP